MSKVTIPADLAQALYDFLTKRPQIWAEVGGMVVGLERSFAAEAEAVDADKKDA